MSETNPEVGKALKSLDEATTTNGGQEEITNRYNKWAKDYDKDARALSYNGYELGAKKLDHFLQLYKFGKNCRILDVGSGTGLAGEALQELNYTNVDGLEPSEGCNNIARCKGIYKKIYVEFLAPGKQMSIASDTYDAALCTGVFTMGHVKAEGAMDEMARVVKPGGLVCFTVREDVMFNENYGHQVMMAKLYENGVWKLLFENREEHIQHVAVKHLHLFVYQIL